MISRTSRLLVLASLAFVSALPAQVSPPPTGSYSLSRKTSTGFEQKAMPSTASTLWTNDATGNPIAKPISDFVLDSDTIAWSVLTGTPTTLAGYGITDAQPLDADLTAIAALTTTAFGRGLLTLADDAALAALVPGDDVYSGAEDDGKLIAWGVGGAVSGSVFNGNSVNVIQAYIGNFPNQAEIRGDNLGTASILQLPNTNGAILAATDSIDGRVNLGSPAVVFGNLSVNNLNSGSGANAGTYWSGNGTWSTPSTAPITARYITQIADATLTNEQALSALPSGLMRSNVTTGTVTTITTSSGIATNISDEVGTGFLVLNDSPTFTTRMTLPNTASPTTSTVAQTAFDTNIIGGVRGAVQVHDGAATTYLVGTSGGPSTTGHVPRYSGSGVIDWAAAGIAESHQQSNGGNQALDNNETDLDPSGGLFPFIMEDVAVNGRKMLVMVTVTIKFDGVTYSNSDSLTFTVKTGGGAGVTTVNYSPGDLTAYTAPPIQIQIPVVFTPGVGTLSLKVTGQSSNVIAAGTISVLSIDSIVLIHN